MARAWKAAQLGIAYALLELIEGVGLWLLTRWGEYFAVIATSVFLPLEIHDLTKGITLTRVVTFSINVAAVVYLLVSKRLFGLRGGRQAYDAEYGGWGGAPKFPGASTIDFLLRRGERGALAGLVCCATGMALSGHPETLAHGALGQAGQLLGRPYRMCGRVAHGDKRGRTIGFPTANIRLHRKASPISGVFAVELFGVAGAPWRGVANVGVRPTVAGLRPLLEVHLFDFSGDLYGRHVCVDFIHKLREERRFDSFEALKSQILLDAQQARECFAQALEKA